MTYTIKVYVSDLLSGESSIWIAFLSVSSPSDDTGSSRNLGTFIFVTLASSTHDLQSSKNREKNCNIPLGVLWSVLGVLPSECNHMVLSWLQKTLDSVLRLVST